MSTRINSSNEGHNTVIQKIFVVKIILWLAQTTNFYPTKHSAAAAARFSHESCREPYIKQPYDRSRLCMFAKYNGRGVVERVET